MKNGNSEEWEKTCGSKQGKLRRKALSNLAQNLNVPRSQEDWITLVSKENEGRDTKKLSQEFSKTKNRTLGALSHLDVFFMNPLFQGQSGTTPEPSRDAFGTNHGKIEDDSKSDFLPEASLLHSQTTRHSGSEDEHDLATGVYEEVT